MKKMVCEICGSQTIRKENGVFVCQECGTEYSADEAKKLLQEVDEKTDSSQEQSSNKNTSVSGKDKLLNTLSLWALNLSKMPDIYMWFDLPQEKQLTEEFWNDTIKAIGKKDYCPIFPKLNSDIKTLFKNGFFYESCLEEINKLAFSDERKNKFPELYENAVLNKEISSRFYKTTSIMDHINYELKGTQFIKSISYFDGNKSFGFYLPAKYVEYGNYTFVYFSKDRDKIIYLKELAQNYCGEGNSKSNELLIQKVGFLGKTTYLSAPINDQKAYDSMLKKSYDTLAEFVKKHNELMDYCSNKFTEICDVVKEIDSNCSKLESELFIPFKYRNVSTILYLIDLVQDGKATAWKELINLYDTHQYRMGVYEKLDAINSKLDIIQNTLVIGFATIAQQLSEVNSNLQDMSAKINLINNDLKSIKKYNFITMWESL